MSPGTLYPMLHALEKRGYLRSRKEQSGRTVRRLYQATPKGLEALAEVRDRAKELIGELFDGR